MVWEYDDECKISFFLLDTMTESNNSKFGKYHYATRSVLSNECPNKFELFNEVTKDCIFLSKILFLILSPSEDTDRCVYNDKHR